MITKKIPFSRSSTTFYFDASFAALKKLVLQKGAVVITDENIFASHEAKFKGWNVIVLKPGEQYKIQPTVDSIVEQLIALGADRGTTLIGVGGGVVTDITGYVASVFLRGVPFGFVPTTLLAMVDAAIGGKNGIDVGVYKNMVGSINQPRFLLYDMDFLKSLPEKEWRNGFAEIIKHAAIKDAAMFKELAGADIAHYQKRKNAMGKLVQKNAMLKAGVVKRDEFEKGERRTLNFGHTLGHALENQYNLMHGEAVAIGMVFAAQLSAAWGFKKVDALTTVIDQYGLPTAADYDAEKVFHILKSDKKKEGDFMHFVLLQKIGKAAVQKIDLSTIKAAL